MHLITFVPLDLKYKISITTYLCMHIITEFNGHPYPNYNSTILFGLLVFIYIYS